MQIAHLDLYKKYDTIISDVRQETNNNLDKLNTWLSFWIGILAVFGVLAPVVAEYRFRLENEKEWEKLKNEMDDTFKKYRTLMAAKELESCVYSLVQCRDFGNSSERTNIAIFLLRQVRTSLRQFIHEFNNENEEPSQNSVCQEILIRMLIFLLSLIQELRYWDCFQNQIRTIDIIQNDILQILRSISNREVIQSRMIIDQLQRIDCGIDNICNSLD